MSVRTLQVPENMITLTRHILVHERLNYLMHVFVSKSRHRNRKLNLARHQRQIKRNNSIFLPL